MRVLVAGASGAVGKALLPMLVARGHVVGGLIRNPAHAPQVRAMGAHPLVADALEPDALTSVFETFQPQAVVHQLTALPANPDLRDFDRTFAATNRLRTEGTDHLVTASRAVGVERFVAQSFCGWTFARTGGPAKTEEDPLDPNPPRAFRRTLDALRHVERAMSDASDLRGIALRYGGFYGPGTGVSRTGAMVEQVRRRRLPVVGDGSGVWSFIHIEDVASATVAALEGNATGIYNVVDDHPAPVREWLPELAAAVGAKPPLWLPALIGRIVLPRHLFLMMTAVRGASNAKFRESFRWQPRYASWREGFRYGL
jgi:2-alkyl-3-oxoalkanoate reductase